MEVDAGAAHRSCERDPLSPTQTQQHEAENDSSTRVHGASGRSARDVAGLGCSWDWNAAQRRVKRFMKCRPLFSIYVLRVSLPES